MTPQLQQAIRLLQLSSLDLQQEIQTALEENPMLELEDNEGERGNGEAPQDMPQQSKESQVDASSDNSMASETMPDDLPVDSAWDDVYDSSVSYRKTSSDSSGYDGFENQDTSEKTLRDHLEWQLNLTPTSDTDKIIAMAIIDSLDDDGYLTDSLEDILASVKDKDDADDDDIGIEEIEAVLHMLQTTVTRRHRTWPRRRCWLIIILICWQRMTITS